MTAPASVGEQVLAGSGGAGSISGLGGTFSADPFTGTGRFEVPLPTPPGHGGLEPGLALRYSSGAGGGLCGVGWSFGPPSIARRTTKGIPQFTDDDVFLLSADELVPIGGDHFLRRTEGAFARIRRVRQGGDDFWAVTERDGTRRLLGRRASHRDGEPGRAVAWHLSEIRDPCDNRVSFSYSHDAGDARAYLAGAEWGPYRLELEYEPRPDVMRSARSGVLLTISRRLREARVQVRHGETGEFVTFDLLRFDYEQSPITGLSLLAAIHRTGADADGNRRELPPVRFTYAGPARRTGAAGCLGSRRALTRRPQPSAGGHERKRLPGSAGEQRQRLAAALQPRGRRLWSCGARGRAGGAAGRPWGVPVGCRGERLRRPRHR